VTPSPPTVVAPSARDIERLLGGHGLQVHFQPIVDLARAVVVGYEALARFPVFGPLDWFGAARQHGVVDRLEAAAIRAALQRRDDLPPNTFMSVNVAPDMLPRPALQSVLEEFAPLHRVVVELTEQVPIDDYRDLEPQLDRLRASGALLAIDDAGAGYAGFQHLLKLRPHFVKLDRDLVAGLHRDEAKRALVQTLGHFASRIDAWILAEGIELAGELETLAAIGVPLAQGYLLGRPQQGFTQLEPEVARQLIARAPLNSRPGLRPLLETVGAAYDEATARRTLSASDQEEMVVLVDEHDHPVATVTPDGLTRSIRDTGVRINIDTEPSDAARRAIVREQSARFLPLVCTDSAGRYLGIVRMERLVEHLADKSSAPG
jgi:EAL domain-containing protein (putative c-di-GMP-specific phosphodiesterase class I)